MKLPDGDAFLKGLIALARAEGSPSDNDESPTRNRMKALYALEGLSYDLDPSTYNETRVEDSDGSSSMTEYVEDTSSPLAAPHNAERPDQTPVLRPSSVYSQSDTPLMRKQERILR